MSRSERRDVDAATLVAAGRPRRAQTRRGGAPGSRARRACAWSLLQLWYASPFPFTLQRLRPQRHGDALAASRLWPLARLPRLSVRQVLAARPDSGVGLGVCAGGGFCGAYLFLFYRELSTRPGEPTQIDFVTAIAGMILLLEATRRVVGPPLAIIALLMLVYAFAGPYMPDVVAHKGVSLSQSGVALLARRPKACSASPSASRRATSSCSCCSARCSKKPAPATTSSRSRSRSSATCAAARRRRRSSRRD